MEGLGTTPPVMLGPWASLPFPWPSAGFHGSPSSCLYNCSVLVSDWDDKPGLPRVVIPVHFGVIGRFPPENPKTDWDDKPRLPRVVTPVSGFFGTFRPENPETDWDDKLGLPRVVIPVCFGLIWPF